MSTIAGLTVVPYYYYLFLGESFNEAVYKKKKKKLSYDAMLEAIRHDWRDKYSKFVYIFICMYSMMGLYLELQILKGKVLQ